MQTFADDEYTWRFTVAALLYAKGKVVTGGFFFVAIPAYSHPRRLGNLNQGGKAEQERLLLYSSSLQHTIVNLSLLVVKNQVGAFMYDKSLGSSPNPQILFQMFDFSFHNWVDKGYIFNLP